MAADVSEAVVGSYEAPASCPDRTRFVALLRSYLDPADVPEALPTFVIRFSVEGGPRGVLQMRAKGDTRESGERTVLAATCDEAALALAYVAALAISPNARSGLGPPPAPLLAPAASASAAPSSSSSAISPPASSSSAPAMSPSAPVAPASAAPPATSAKPTELPPEPRWSVSLGLSAETGVAPAIAPGLVLSGERRVGAFVVGLDAFGSRRTSDPAGPGDARFTLLGGRVVACPFTVGGMYRMGLSFCGSFAAGRVAATSNGLDRPGSSFQPWLVPGVRLRARLGLGGGFGLALSGDVGVPLVRPTYRFDEPAIIVFEVPPVVFGLGLAVFRSF